jgi:hypothetical protein
LRLEPRLWRRGWLSSSRHLRGRRFRGRHLRRRRSLGLGRGHARGSIDRPSATRAELGVRLQPVPAVGAVAYFHGDFLPEQPGPYGTWYTPRRRPRTLLARAGCTPTVRRYRSKTRPEGVGGAVADRLEDEARVEAQGLGVGQPLRRRDVHAAEELVDEPDGLPARRPAHASVQRTQAALVQVVGELPVQGDGLTPADCVTW